ncbi:HET-domain-containing protein [Neofusicoccum parvum]|uniref:HET-domain-containing protein, partial n=1 Tax=Neofusicoccum parvum TaxID=310453 RepID=A0ACB5SKX5_9PEZI|nr:HET-domain-containing protein [Neofusicoccum parvum]GME65568.1 HET-domain-containing protein [Neofusicoccum parvum]
MANLPKRRFEIVLSELPKTVQDALTVTRELGFRYLWVDSLCIVQDDSHDWAKEVGKMAEVYMGASVTISACSASNAEQGFLYRRRLDDVLGIRYRPQLLKFRYQCLPPEATQPENVATGWLHVANWGNSSCKHPVEERAWTLQEFLLSRRLLVYCAGRIQWLCNGAMADEHDIRIRSTARTLLPRMTWRGVLKEYSGRASSHSDDRLAALGAVALQFALLQRQSRQLPPSPPASTTELAKDYLAGLWRDDLFVHLGWYTVYAWPLPRAPWRAPSWSWAAVDSAVAVWSPQADGEPPPLLPRLLADEVVPAFVENPFGAVAKAVLRIEAPLLRVRYCYLPKVAAEAGKRLEPDGVIVVLRNQSGAADEEEMGVAAGGVLGQEEGSVASGDAALEGNGEIVHTPIYADALDSLPFLTVADASERREQVAELWLMRVSNLVYLVLVEVGEGVFRRCGALNLDILSWEAKEPTMGERAMLQRAMNRVPWRTFDFV